MDFEKIINDLRAFKEEKEWFDFKENWFDANGIGEYISALSNGAALLNQKYGYLIWGISDESHEVVGTQVQWEIKIKGEPLDHFLIRQLNPAIEFKFTELCLLSKRVVVLQIAAAQRLPTDFAKKRFIRVGSNKVDLEKYRDREIALWDALKAEGETMVNKAAPFFNQNLSFKKLFLYYGMKGVEINQETFEKNLHLRTPEGNFNILVLVLADQNEIPIRVSVFSGTSKADPLFSVKEYGNTCLLFSIEQLLMYGDSLNIMQADEKNRVVERKEVPFFDGRAFREAVMNAFVHNHWVTLNAPMINVFTDRIEILSRGTLAQGQTYDGFFKGESIPVNPELATIFLQLRLSERSGMGVPKILRAYGKEAFAFNENSIVVTLPFHKMKINEPKVDHPVDQSLGATKIKIVGLFLDKNTMTSKEMAQSLGLSIQAIKKNVKQLKDSGVIERIGDNRKGFWKVK